MGIGTVVPSSVVLPPMKTKKHNTTTTTAGGSVVATTTAERVRNNPKKNPWNNNSAGVLDHRLLAMGVPSDPEVSSSSSSLGHCSIQLLNGIGSTGQHPATERRLRQMSEAEPRHRWRRQGSPPTAGGRRHWGPWGTTTAVGVLVFIVVFIDLFCASASSSIHSGSSSSSSHRTLEHAAVEAVADLRLSEIYGKDDSRFHPSKEFSRHSRIQPRLVHGRHKRSIASTREENGLHASHLTLSYRLSDRTEDVILDLQLNERLVPRGHFLSYQLPSGDKVVRRYNRTDELELCHYWGVIRDVPESSVALSTCHGIRGVVFDGHDTYYIESDVKTEGLDRIDLADHYIYRHSDLITSAKCGYEGGSNATHDPDLHRESEFQRLSRHKRATAKSTSPIRGPYNANKHSSYVELVIVIDNKMFKSMKENFKVVQQYCKDITNIINALYEPLNIFIGLVGVVIWNEANEIELSTDGEVTLKNFLHYRKKVLSKDHPNDNAQLFTKEHFEGGVVGKALKGPICTYEFSGGVEMYHSEIIGVQATTVAHEMGHNFGMEHDTPDCKCKEDRCIMSASSSSIAPRHWSSCSIDQLNLAFHHGMNYCLKNKPTQLFDSPVCGNGFVEPGEQCDCGLPEFCDNSCCNPRTCMLHSNASCATGQCCDLQTCKPKVGGTVCREAEGECDLPEYCSGESEYCPSDVFKRDTETCDDGKAFCYKGSCRSQNDQCRLLWGPTGKSSDQCYKKNEEGTRHGNCGYNRVKNEYVKCDEGDVFCGMLHCRHLNERLEFGMESVAILSHSFMTYNGSVIPCRSAIVDLGLQKVDPGLAPDGAKCGEGKMCLNQVCMAVESLRAQGSGVECPENCNGNGICNSEGHCHCSKGFAPPLCNSPGNGGSEDSGPASDPNAGSGFTRFLYIFFCGVVPTCAIFSFFVYYVRRNGSGLLAAKKRKPPSASVSTGNMKTDSSRSTGSTHTMVPSSPNSPDDMNSALLRPSSDVDFKTNNHNNHMFGKFKGFTLKPLPEPGSILKSPNVAFVHPVSKYSEDPASTVPNRPAPPAPKLANSKPAHTVQIGNSTYNKPAGIHQINGYKLANHEHQMDSVGAPALPPLNPGSTARPIISSPILESSTCTNREITHNNGKVPIRPAPVLPPQVQSNPSGSQENIEILINPSSKEKKTKESKINRITSYLKKENEKPPKPEPKNIKIADKEKLKNIEISAPIPIAGNDLAKSMPKLNEAEPLSPKSAAIQRAKSMRDPEVSEKRSPGDGQASVESARKPSTLKRPQSMVGHRPTMPPPRPPVPPAPAITGMKIPGVPGYQNPPAPKSVTIVTPPRQHDYDDCQDVEDSTTTTTAGSSPALGHDNIYSVIDESPSPPSMLSPPTTLSSGSSESMGLLGEIVNEIESRGSDSVYIASTLKRDGSGSGVRRKMAPRAEEEEDEPTYVNTSEIQDDEDGEDATDAEEEPYPAKSSGSTTSSNYLRPSAINTPIARVAPSKPESVSTSLSSFKNNGPGVVSPTNVLSTLQFEGPTAESTTKPPLTAKTYKPYHSTLSNTRPGSVVAATKSKLANGDVGKPKLNRTVTPPGLSGVTKKPATVGSSSVRTRSPSPKGRTANGGVTTGKAVSASTTQKPKTAAKPDAVVKGKVAASGSKILSAAARPGPGKVSNVASLQQKFEGKK